MFYSSNYIALFCLNMPFFIKFRSIPKRGGGEEKVEREGAKRRMNDKHKEKGRKTLKTYIRIKRIKLWGTFKMTQLVPPLNDLTHCHTLIAILRCLGN